MEDFVYIVIKKLFVEHPNLLMETLCGVDYSDVKIFSNDELAYDYLNNEMEDAHDAIGSNPYIRNVWDKDDIFSDVVESVEEYTQTDFNERGVKMGFLVMKQKIITEKFAY